MAVTTIRHRRGQASVWAEKNPVLQSGEFGVETNTGAFKLGDGVTPWNALPYFVSGGGGGGGGPIAWTSVVEKPTTFPPSAHTHDTRYVRTINGTSADINGNVTISAGGTISLPDSLLIGIKHTGTAWPARPVGGSAIRVHWIGGSPSTPPPGLSGHDLWSVPAQI